MSNTVRMLVYKGKLDLSNIVFDGKGKSFLRKPDDKSLERVAKYYNERFEEAKTFGQFTSYMIIERTGAISEAQLEERAVEFAKELKENGAERVIVIRYPVDGFLEDLVYDSETGKVKYT